MVMARNHYSQVIKSQNIYGAEAVRDPINEANRTRKVSCQLIVKKVSHIFKTAFHMIKKKQGLITPVWWWERHVLNPMRTAFSFLGTKTTLTADFFR